MGKRLPRYGRVSNPPNFRLTERDKNIIEAIYSYDGLLSFSQIQRLFFSGKSQTELRLRLLYQHKYLNRLDQKRRLLVPDMVYWLDRNGAEYVASLDGTPLSEFSWRKEPRWIQIEHDIAVNDFRLDLEEACRLSQAVKLEIWVSETSFKADPDKVEYKYKDKKVPRNVIPDGYFMISTEKHNIRYLLELDRRTEDNPRFLRDKILPGLAYIKSQAYQDRFGHRSGRWLVVTTGQRRMQNMLRFARQAEAKGVFYFTTFDQIRVDTILYEPIWRRADRDDLVPLLFVD